MLYSGLIVDGTYQIINEIGSGGMGVVYLAYHLRLEKYIVMKKIKDCNADMALLRNEVDVLKGLHHPYLPQVYDFIQYENDLYTIIDYIDGYDLKYYIDNNHVFSEGQLIKWLRQLCEVLNYLHTHNPQVLHTDIKPANIIITGSGDICLIDFGISLTGNDRIKGISVDYSSPEQYNNVHYIKSGYSEYCVTLDERVDIYSLGATFYHMITGIKPNLLTQLPKASAYNYGYSDVFTGIIDKCMETNRDNRYRSAAQLLKAIDGIYKLDKRYKKYILLQVVLSLLAGVMIIAGSVMIIAGNRNNVAEAYEAQYSSFLSLSKKGDSEGAVSAGYALINDSRFNSVMDKNTKALVLHAIGDCYYESDDFYNASYYYKQAIQTSEDSNKTQLYYRDYALALVNDNQIQTAKAVINELSALYPNSVIGALVDVQIDYKNRNYENALRQAEQLESRLAGDADNLYTVCLIKGNCYNELRNYRMAVDAYSKALKAKETADVLRRLGNSSLKYANTQNSEQLYRQALGTFETLYAHYEPTVDDIINLAQCYLLCSNSNDYQNCMTVLQEYLSLYGDNFRVYVMLSVASDAVGDAKTQEYCLKAKSMYAGLSEEELEHIDAESLSQIKNLYQKYCGGVW